MFDIFLKTAARNDEASALGRKDDFRVRYPRRANIFGVKEPQGVTKTEAASVGSDLLRMPNRER